MRVKPSEYIARLIGQPTEVDTLPITVEATEVMGATEATEAILGIEAMGATEATEGTMVVCVLV